MAKNRFYISIICVVFFNPPLPIMADEIRYGLWQIETTLRIDGIPSNVPASKSTHCINSSNYLPGLGKQHKDCDLKHDTDGGSISWSYYCRATKTKGKGRIRFSGRKMRGSSRVVRYARDRGSSVITVVSYTGQYLGSCRRKYRK